MRSHSLRSAEMRATAEALGLDFAPRARPFHLRDPLWNFVRSGPFVEHRIYGNWQGHDIDIFDFDPDDNDRPRTAISFTSDQLVDLSISIRPFTYRDAWAARLSGGVLRLGPGDAINPRYVVAASETPDTRLESLLSMETFQQSHHLVVRAAAGRLMIYDNRSVLPADQIPVMLEQGREFIELLAKDGAPTAADNPSETKLGEFVWDQTKTLYRWGAIAASLVLMAVSLWNLTLAYRQYGAAHLATTSGKITRLEFDEVGDPGGLVATAFEYQYVVNGRPYANGLRRFVWRPLRQGDGPARQLTRHWQLGREVPVFYDPKDPSVSILDNTFIDGDRYFALINGGLGLVGIGLLIGSRIDCHKSATLIRQRP